MSGDELKALETVERDVEAMRASAKSSFRNTVWVYGILVVFVAWYTTWVFSYLQSLATPDTVAVLIGDQARANIPKATQYIRQDAIPNCGVTVDKLVNSAHEMVPQLESSAITHIDSITSELAEEARKKYFPTIKQFVDESLQDVIANKDLVQDEHLAEAMAIELVKGIDQELDAIFRDNYYNQIAYVRREIDSIAETPRDKLTAKQDSERKLLMCWYQISKNADHGGGFISEGIQRVNKLLQGHLQGFPKE